MSAAPERDGTFREFREFILSLASFDAWRVSGRERQPVLSSRNGGGRLDHHRSTARRSRVERLFAVRTYTGSPHCAEAQSNQGGTDHAVTVSDWSPLAPRATVLAPP
ncbi:MAG: hypothetical protein ABJE10_20560 [bacterium]